MPQRECKNSFIPPRKEETHIALFIFPMDGGAYGIFDIVFYERWLLWMTKVTVDPGVCGLMTLVEAASEDQAEVLLKVRSGCPSVEKIMEELGEVFDAYELCLAKPGADPLHEYAAAHFPGHASCPVLAGIIKCAEVECRLALPKNASISFETT